MHAMHVTSTSRLFRTTLSIISFGIIAPNALAFESHSTENEWQSATINALGGVGQMSENQADIFFSDPSLAADQKQSFSMQFGSISGTASQGAVNLYQDAQKLSKSSNNASGGISETLNLLDNVRGLFGKQIDGALSISLLSVRIKNLNFVPYVNAIVDAGVHVPALPQASAVADSYAGFGIGYSHGFGGSIGNKSKGGGTQFSLGVNLRPGVRARGVFTADAATLGDLSSTSSTGSSASNASNSTNAADKYLQYGVATYLPVDVALGWRPTNSTRANFVVRDFLGAPSLSTVYGSSPGKYPARVSLGGHWHARAEQTSSFVLGSEIQDILNLSQQSGLWYRWQWAAQYRYRLPFRIRTTFSLNTGLQSGYPSYGAELDLFLAKIEISRSTRELGYYIGQQPDTRTSIRITSSMAF